MNEVELRIDKFIHLLDLTGKKELVNIKKYTITKFREDLLFDTDSLVLKSLKYTIDQIEDRCGRLNIYRFNVIDIREREVIYHLSKNENRKDFIKKFNEEMYEGYLYFVETTKSKKPLLLIHADKSDNVPYKSEDFNDDRFVVLM